MKNIKITTKIKALNLSEVVFELKPYQSKWLEEAKDKELVIVISDKKDRSLQQNAKMWALIHEIDKEVNGYSSQEGEAQIYMQLLYDCNIRPDYLNCLKEAIPTLEKFYRIVEIIEDHDDMVTVKCYRGTSSFNTEQMSEFIEKTLNYAEIVGIDTTEYEMEE